MSGFTAPSLMVWVSVSELSLTEAVTGSSRVFRGHGTGTQFHAAIARLKSLISSVQTYPTQNSSRPNHQDAGGGNSLTNVHTAKLSTFWSAGNAYLASKTADHFLVLT